MHCGYVQHSGHCLASHLEHKEGPKHRSQHKAADHIGGVVAEIDDATEAHTPAEADLHHLNEAASNEGCQAGCDAIPTYKHVAAGASPQQSSGCRAKQQLERRHLLKLERYLK